MQKSRPLLTLRNAAYIAIILSRCKRKYARNIYCNINPSQQHTADLRLSGLFLFESDLNPSVLGPVFGRVIGDNGMLVSVPFNR